MEGCATQSRQEIPVAYSEVDGILPISDIHFWHSIPNWTSRPPRRYEFEGESRENAEEKSLFLFSLPPLVDRLSYLIFLRRLRYILTRTETKNKNRDATKYHENHALENTSLDDRFEFPSPLPIKLRW